MVKSLITLDSIEYERKLLVQECANRKARRLSDLGYILDRQFDSIEPAPQKFFTRKYTGSPSEFIEPAKPKKKSKQILSAPQRLLARIRRRALHKGWDCELTLDDCTNLVDCFYCGSKSTGFDRIDSYSGYTHDNVIAACGTCNCMKMRMDQQDFIDQCKYIAERFTEDYIMPS